MTPKKKTTTAPPAFQWAVPAKLKIPPDPLRARLDFHEQATTLTVFHGDTASTKIVSATDVAHALAKELSFNSGLLPINTLWWSNSADGPVFALYEKPQVRILALSEAANKPPRRFKLPMPGFVFLCQPGKAPWVYAVKSEPTKETDEFFRAPLFNVFENGSSCPGNHKYPARAADVPASFWRAFFSRSCFNSPSKKHKGGLIKLWESLEGKPEFPMGDLVRMGTIKNLLQLRMNDGRRAELEADDDE